MTKHYSFILGFALLAASMVSRAQQTTNIFIFKGAVFQKITVQYSGWYFIKATGAQGGESSNERYPGGAGATVSGFFYVKANDSLRIAVGGMGQKGQNNGNSVSGGGGGGASSIVNMRGSTFYPLLIAGGGGGGSTSNSGLPGLKTNNGGDGGLTLQSAPGYIFKAGGTGGSGSRGGNIGSKKYGGAGGAGYSGDGGTHCDGACNGSNLLSYGGQAYLSGNFGGNSGNRGGDGGWGGGGEGRAATSNDDGGGGGGGGWSGGGGGSDENSDLSDLSGGGGGGSYVDFDANRKGLSDSSGTNLWDGYVLIQGPVLDSDGDGVFDQADNCSLPNPDQQDVNLDGIGDACQSGTSLFSFQGPTFQTYLIPKKGIYKLEARGGAGGPSSDRVAAGGKGGYISGYFLLDSASILRIGVGEAGHIGANTENLSSGGGGGGASWVVQYDAYGLYANKLLIAGGGGGGLGYIDELADAKENISIGHYSAPGGDALLSATDDGRGGRVWTKREATGGGGGGFIGNGESAQNMNYDFNLGAAKYSVQGGKSYINGYNGGSYSGQGGGRGGWGGGGQGGTAMKYVTNNHFTGFGGGGGGNEGGDGGGFAPGASAASMGGTSFINSISLHKSTTPPFSAAEVPPNGMVALKGPLSDLDGDFFTDDIDNCVIFPNKDQTDLDYDGVGDLCDSCQEDFWKSSPADCGCNTADADVNANGVKDCKEGIFNVYNGGRQRYQVPKTGWYLIDAKGAKGGDTYIHKGGKGTQMQAYYHLDSSDILEVIVGSVGETGDRPDPLSTHTRRLQDWKRFTVGGVPLLLPTKFASTGCFADLYSGAGGGGSSSVSRVKPVTQLLVVAGGGGGASYRNPGLDGTKNSCAENTYNAIHTVCVSRPGSGGLSLQTNIFSGAGGGGILSGGQGQDDGKDIIISRGGTRTGPYGPNHGGYSFDPGGDGGYGGGGEGGVYDCSKKDGHGGGGGGGGYSGGIGGDGTGSPGGGGGSFIEGGYKGLMVSGQNNGEGSVTIIGPRIQTDTVRTPGAYTWPRNGVTYRSSGIYVWVDSLNAITRTLDLSITKLGGTLGSSVGGSLMAYPNPSDGLVTLRTPSLDVVSRLEIISIDGRLIKEFELAARTTRFQVDLRKYGAGVYIFRMLAQGEDERITVIVQ